MHNTSTAITSDVIISKDLESSIALQLHGKDARISQLSNGRKARSRSYQSTLKDDRLTKAHSKMTVLPKHTDRLTKAHSKMTVLPKHTDRLTKAHSKMTVLPKHTQSAKH